MTLRAIQAYWSLVVVQLCAIVALLIACSALIPRYGLQGCAVACVISVAVDALGRVFLHYLLVMRPFAPIALSPEVMQAA